MLYVGRRKGTPLIFLHGEYKGQDFGAYPHRDFCTNGGVLSSVFAFGLTALRALRIHESSVQLRPSGWLHKKIRDTLGYLFGVFDFYGASSEQTLFLPRIVLFRF